MVHETPALVLTSSTPDRSLIRRQFLDNLYLELAQIHFLAGDASWRQYYRIELQSQSWVLMDAPPPEKPQDFIHIAQILCNHGLSAPKIYHADLDQGLVLLEDFGNLTFSKALQEGHDEQKLYELAVDTLIELHHQFMDIPSQLSPYSLADYMAEVQLLIDWYYPALNGCSLSADRIQEYKDLWYQFFTQTMTCPKSLVLRDYHVDNLMVLPSSYAHPCGLLDFQDARWGATVYDVVSLLEDARRDISPTLTHHLWQRYTAAFPNYSPDHLRQVGAILSAGRHAKIIGIFTRLAIRDGKLSYLSHIPRVWRLLEQCLDHPTLAPLKHWFDMYITKRDIPCLSTKP
ncbi:MAG TPA: phosphotransferase [Candidatus Nitrosotenuis sp.]|jgi:aminoglycoside/choline kinase family phosphotransferase|nr:phosphotransferase [Candidatus Nitrosotenuis sp.]